MAFTLARALVYAALFIALVLVYLPGLLAGRAGLVAPARIGAAQGLGLLVTGAGAALAVSCVLAFSIVGRGTPAPFDPPRRLVVRGPYRWLRNPMYVGACAALLGAALYYRSWALLEYAAGFLIVMHLFVMWYEEPALRRRFGTEYEAYCRRVSRWWPRPPSVTPHP